MNATINEDGSITVGETTIKPEYVHIGGKRVPVVCYHDEPDNLILIEIIHCEICDYVHNERRCPVCGHCND